MSFGTRNLCIFATFRLVLCRLREIYALTCTIILGDEKLEKMFNQTAGTIKLKSNLCYHCIVVTDSIFA